MKVFVYGTLKKHSSNHHLLTEEEYLGEAITEDKYHLVGHHFPYAIPPFYVSHETNVYPILGEIYNIVHPKTLQRLDYLENHPNWYCRNMRKFTLVEGEEAGCLVNAYIYERPEIEPDYPPCAVRKHAFGEVFEWKSPSSSIFRSV
jgi:gamma-glutamylcyclotransferase (GGCT)/AIG2-like uncharacterized protein YtfP